MPLTRLLRALRAAVGARSRCAMEIFCADGAGTGRVAERAAPSESATRPARPFDALATMPRALPREADADAHDEWTLAEACYSWSRYVESNHNATSAARPDDECPCAGAARSEEYLVSCDPVRPAPRVRRPHPAPAPHPRARSPPDPPRTSPSKTNHRFSAHPSSSFIPFPRGDDATKRRRASERPRPPPTRPSPPEYA